MKSSVRVRLIGSCFLLAACSLVALESCAQGIELNEDGLCFCGNHGRRWASVLNRVPTSEVPKLLSRMPGSTRMEICNWLLEHQNEVHLNVADHLLSTDRIMRQASYEYLRKNKVHVAQKKLIERSMGVKNSRRDFAFLYLLNHPPRDSAYSQLNGLVRGLNSDDAGEHHRHLSIALSQPNNSLTFAFAFHFFSGFGGTFDVGQNGDLVLSTSKSLSQMNDRTLGEFLKCCSPKLTRSFSPSFVENLRARMKNDTCPPQIAAILANSPNTILREECYKLLELSLIHI